MVKEKSLVVYKGRPALVTETAGDKIGIRAVKAESKKGRRETEDLKVREKDIVPLHPGPADLSFLDDDNAASSGEAQLKEAWELLQADDPEKAGFKTAAELAFGAWTPAAAWAFYLALKDGLYFYGDIDDVRLRSAEEAGAELKKRSLKAGEAAGREAFLAKIKAALAAAKKAAPSGTAPAACAELSAEEKRYLQDAEALALGKTDKSRTLRELGLAEDPVEAHRLLLSSGVWDRRVNPHPGRYGLSLASAAVIPSPPPAENRADLTRLAAFAIDNEWSDDPDDAVSLEGPDGEGRYTLYVHVADPASSVLPGSPADVEARGRGATLYLPEGASRMMAGEALDLFALGLGGGPSPALTFKILLKKKLIYRKYRCFSLAGQCYPADLRGSRQGGGPGRHAGRSKPGFNRSKGRARHFGPAFRPCRYQHRTAARRRRRDHRDARGSYPRG